MSHSRKFTLLFLALLGSQVFAQKFYFSLGMGPGIGIEKDLHQEFYDFEIVGDDEIRTSKPMSFGKGYNAHLRFGYRLKSKIDLALEASFFKGGKTTFTKDYWIDWPPVRGGNSSIDLYGNSFSLNPSITFRPFTSKFAPYFRIGPNISFVTTWEEFNSMDFQPNSNSSFLKRKNYGGLGIGFIADLGVAYQLNESWGLYSEIRINSFKNRPGQSTIIEFTQNGKDELSSLTTDEKEEIYSNYISRPSRADGRYRSPDDPMEFLKFDQPFSSIQLLIGISYYL